MVGSGVSLPWNLALSALIGLSLLFTRITLGAEGGLANADHLIGSLVLTVVSIAAAEVARPVRYVNALLGAALFVTPFLYDADVVATVTSSFQALRSSLSAFAEVRSGIGMATGAACWCSPCLDGAHVDRSWSVQE